jgi:UDP-glucose 4-epimerase
LRSLESVPAGARFYEADIRSGCAETFRDFKPEALCHQAG